MPKTLSWRRNNFLRHSFPCLQLIRQRESVAGFGRTQRRTPRRKQHRRDRRPPRQARPSATYPACCGTPRAAPVLGAGHMLIPWCGCTYRKIIRMEIMVHVCPSNTITKLALERGADQRHARALASSGTGSTCTGFARSCFSACITPALRTALMAPTSIVVSPPGSL